MQWHFGSTRSPLIPILFLVTTRLLGQQHMPPPPRGDIPYHFPTEAAPEATRTTPITGGSLNAPSQSVKTSVSTEDSPARWHTGIEVGLSVGVLAFGALLVALEVILLARRPEWPSGLSLKLLGLTLVVTAGLFLIVAGFSQNQTASMMGLLGTVAGYILGKDIPDVHKSSS